MWRFGLALWSTLVAHVAALGPSLICPAYCTPSELVQVRITLPETVQSDVYNRSKVRATASTDTLEGRLVVESFPFQKYTTVDVSNQEQDQLVDEDYELKLRFRCQAHVRAPSSASRCAVEHLHYSMLPYSQKQPSLSMSLCFSSRNNLGSPVA